MLPLLETFQILSFINHKCDTKRKIKRDFPTELFAILEPRNPRKDDFETTEVAQINGSFRL